jgi:hypothetical protein
LNPRQRYSIRRISNGFVPVSPRTNYLWHFVRWTQKEKLLTFLSGGLWFARLDEFHDELEGTLPSENVGLLRKTLVPEQADCLILRAYMFLLAHLRCEKATSEAPSTSVKGTAYKTAFNHTSKVKTFGARQLFFADKQATSMLATSSTLKHA